MAHDVGRVAERRRRRPRGLQVLRRRRGRLFLRCGEGRLDGAAPHEQVEGAVVRHVHRRRVGVAHDERVPLERRVELLPAVRAVGGGRVRRPDGVRRVRERVRAAAQQQRVPVRLRRRRRPGAGALVARLDAEHRVRRGQVRAALRLEGGLGLAQPRRGGVSLRSLRRGDARDGGLERLLGPLRLDPAVPRVEGADRVRREHRGHGVRGVVQSEVVLPGGV